MTPLSIEIAWSSLADSAVTRAGHEISESCSGNKAEGTLAIIWSTNTELLFSIKKTGVLFLLLISFASLIKFSICQLFFL